MIPLDKAHEEYATWLIGHQNALASIALDEAHRL